MVVPDELLTVLRVVVEQLRAGNGVSIAPLHAEPTTVEASDIFSVSRPHLVKIHWQAATPYRMVDSHRRTCCVVRRRVPSCVEPPLNHPSHAPQRSQR